MIKVLHITGSVDVGGVSSVILNYYKFINRNVVSFDIAITTNNDGINGKHLRNLGANIYKIALKSANRKQFEKDIETLIYKNKYDIVHVHGNYTSWVALRVAKRCGVKVRIAHAHTAVQKGESIREKLKRVTGFFLNSYYSTSMIACGKMAGDYVFGRINMLRRKSIILPNSVDVEHYKYNEKIRHEVIASLNLENKFVVGIVGRISPEKNVLYGVDIFKSIKEKISNSILVVVGDGGEMDNLKRKIVDDNLESDVLCLGKRDDINRLLQAFDLLIMPSLYEGFPVVAVEAMASGLPVLLSDRITKELDFGSAVRYLPLNNKNDWAETASEFINDSKRSERTEEVIDNGLDIRYTVDSLMNLYSGSNIYNSIM